MSHRRPLQFFRPTLSLSESLLHSGVCFISPLRWVGDQTLQLGGSFCNLGSRSAFSSAGSRTWSRD